MSTILSIITPINLEEEKEKFFKSKTYCPQLKYSWDHDAIKKSFKGIRKISSNFFDSILNHQPERISQTASEFFESHIDNNILTYAKKILTNQKPEKNHNVQKLSTVLRKFEDAFLFFEIDYQLTVQKKEGFNFRPAHHKRRLLISHKANFQYLPLEGSVKHELVHVIRYLNGLHNKIKYRWRYLPTEEGLACYIQDYHTKNGSVSLYQHAAEYVATDISLKGSMRDVYNFFRDSGFDEQFAWSRGIRHKFGFQDTSKPGDIMKPSMYFFNEQKIKLLSKDEILRLFVGKVSFKDLTKYPNYKGAFTEKKVREFFELT
jgi:hypothetical protein